MDLARMLRHLFTTAWSVGKVFPAETLANIEAAIGESETAHSGQIRFAVQHSLDTREVLRGISARQRAIEVFGELGVWDTEHNNGVLIYFLLADRDFEIIGDRGIDARVGPEGWEAICHGMEERIREGDFERAVIWGIEAVGEHLRASFPREGGPAGHLPDRPVIL
ncbi:MAG TPA: TPM domain-containing protein [Gemmatimonadota bacterium]|nr:TPM domain-containing protein [Gemmatimonadota bacterium]